MATHDQVIPLDPPEYTDEGGQAWARAIASASAACRLAKSDSATAAAGIW